MAFSEVDDISPNVEFGRDNNGKMERKNISELSKPLKNSWTVQSQ